MLTTMFRSDTLKNPPDWFKEYFSGEESDSGVRVDGRTALTYSTWWQATNVISGDVATMPLDLYQRVDERSREKARRHPGYRVMRRRPNPEMSASTFKRTLQAHALGWGNGYARIVRNGRGEIDSMWIRRPDKTQVHRDSQGLYYESQVQIDENRWEIELTEPQDMFHIRGLGWDGSRGYSVIKFARDSIGLGLAQERYGSTFFKNNARPGGYIEAQQGTTVEGAEQLLDRWNKKHAGAKNAHTMGILINAKYQQLGIPNEDAQFLESRTFQRGEVASWFNLPPHKVGEMSRATFSNIEELNRDYLNTTLMHWLTTWEDECWFKLLTEQQRIMDSHYFEFNTANLLRGTLAERYTAYSIGRQGEWLSPNDIRALENMNPIEGGDDYTNPNVKSAEPPVEPEVPEEDDEEEQETPNDVARQLFTNSLRKLIRTECRRVKHFARNPREFLSRYKEFYEDWRAKILEAIAPAGGTQATANDYCEMREATLLETAGGTTMQELETVIDRLVESWPEYAETLADSTFSKGNTDEK